jgi:ribose 5-phosphate isomerase B
MKIALATDHRGQEFKKRIVVLLDKLGHEIVDFGAHGPESTDFPDFGRPAAEAVARGECERGILVCGTGIGMSMVANKVKGVRGALCLSKWMAEMSRQHNDANVLCLGADTTPKAELDDIVTTWLSTPFDGGGRHERRVAKIMRTECR